MNAPAMSLDAWRRVIHLPNDAIKNPTAREWIGWDGSGSLLHDQAGELDEEGAAVMPWAWA